MLSRYSSVSALLLLMACSSSDPGPSSSSGGSSGTAAATCSAACKAAATCLASPASGKARTTDLVGCEAQCGLELAGKGTLAPDIAELVFASLARAPGGADADCLLGYGLAQFGGQRFDGIKDPAYLDSCVTRYRGRCPDSDVSAIRGDCFSDLYTFSSSTRKEMEVCFGVGTSCADFGQCYGSRRSQFVPACPVWLGPSGAACR